MLTLLEGLPVFLEVTLKWFTHWSYVNRLSIPQLAYCEAAEYQEPLVEDVCFLGSIIVGICTCLKISRPVIFGGKHVQDMHKPVGSCNHPFKANPWMSSWFSGLDILNTQAAPPHLIHQRHQRRESRNGFPPRRSWWITGNCKTRPGMGGTWCHWDNSWWLPGGLGWRSHLNHLTILWQWVEITPDCSPNASTTHGDWSSWNQRFRS